MAIFTLRFGRGLMVIGLLFLFFEQLDNQFVSWNI